MGYVNAPRGSMTLFSCGPASLLQLRSRLMLFNALMPARTVRFPHSFLTAEACRPRCSDKKRMR